MTSEVFVFPVSYGQQRLWFMEQLQPGTSLFNLSIPVRLNTPVSVKILERSLNEIVCRHESLRTTFAVVHEKVVQLINPSVEHKLVVVDLTHLSPSAREEEGARLASIEAQTPFDLIHGPLLRTTLIKIDDLDHIFILTMHHIISDGWSLGIFWRELNTLCQAFAAGNPSPLPELTIQYADFSVWQREWLQGGALDSQLAYWKHQLSDLPVPELPTDNPRPKIQTFAGARYPVSIPGELTAALMAASRREGVTLFMMVLAAFQTLLYRYTGQPDTVLGTYIAGRNRSELEAVIGFFLNTLVLRTKLNSNDSFAEVLKRVRQVTLEAYAHQDVPFAKLVEELQPVRDLGRNPLFQVMFQLLNVPTLSREKDAPQPNVMEVPCVSSVFDLSFMLEEVGMELSGHIEYNTALFNANSIKRMFGHYLNLLEQVLGDMHQRIGDLQLQTRAEQIQQAEWNRTERDYSQSGDIVSWFDAQVKLRPDAVAFFCNGQELTYGEIDRRSNKLARFLQSQGAGPEKIVGVYLDRSFDFIVALISIFRVGAVYLPLDPSYPSARLRFMIEDAKISVLITKRELLGIVGGQCSNTICIDADFEEINRQHESKLDPVVKVSPEQPAYVIYTSGSTGEPKGVIVPHRQVINRFQWMWEAYPFEPHEVCSQKTAVSFVDSIWELLGPLLQGIPTLIIPDEVIRDPFALIKALGEYRVTRLWVVPSLLGWVLDAEPDLEKRLPLLKFWVTSGEALSVELLEKFQQQMPGSILYNLYGTSEVWDVTWFDTREYKSTTRRHVPIGTPISNMKIYVVDSCFRLAPIGIPGELWVGGDGLATSYLGDPALSAEKFVPDVFGAEAGAKLYRTGDLVRYLPNGDLEFLQRIDTQVKVRGFRVELGEVESALCRCPGVKEAVVVFQDQDGAEKRVVGYVVMKGLHPPTMADLRSLLKEVLPDHMIPAALVPMESLPLLPNGKRDKLQLPKPKLDERRVNGKHVPPGSEVEMMIAGVWSDVLQFEQIGLHDNFFDLGGHSLLLFQVYSKLRDRFDQQFSITDLFKYPTVSALANYFTAGPAHEATALQNVRDRVQKHRQSFSRIQAQAG